MALAASSTDDATAQRAYRYALDVEVDLFEWLEQFVGVEALFRRR
jgi:hypothetical protein